MVGSHSLAPVSARGGTKGGGTKRGRRTGTHVGRTGSGKPHAPLDLGLELPGSPAAQVQVELEVLRARPPPGDHLVRLVYRATHEHLNANGQRDRPTVCMRSTIPQARGSQRCTHTDKLRRPCRVRREGEACSPPPRPADQVLILHSRVPWAAWHSNAADNEGFRGSGHCSFSGVVLAAVLEHQRLGNDEGRAVLWIAGAKSPCDSGGADDAKASPAWPPSCAHTSQGEWPSLLGGLRAATECSYPRASLWLRGSVHLWDSYPRASQPTRSFVCSFVRLGSIVDFR